MELSGSLVLLFHRMGSVFVRSTVRGQYVFPSVFRAQLRKLLGNGYHPVAMSDLLSRPRDPGQMAVTFDDGYTSVNRLAVPILRDLGVPVTIFVVAAYMGKTNHWDEICGDRTEPLLDAVELRELAAAGIEIGSHTLHHANLPRLTDAELRAEVRDSKHVLEDMLGKAVHGFSYPYGAWDARVRAAVVEAGYRYATATTLGTVDGTLDPFAIPRINMRWNTVGPLFSNKIHRAYLQSQAHRAMASGS